VRAVAARVSTCAPLEIPAVEAKPAACKMETAAVALAALYSAQSVRVMCSGSAAALGPTLTPCVPLSETPGAMSMVSTGDGCTLPGRSMKSELLPFLL
jgi:hypothetical protein